MAKEKKRFVRYSEGAELYSMGITKFQELCKDAKACYKVNQLVLAFYGVQRSLFRFRTAALQSKTAA